MNHELLNHSATELLSIERLKAENAALRAELALKSLPSSSAGADRSEPTPRPEPIASTLERVESRFQAKLRAHLADRLRVEAALAADLGSVGFYDPKRRDREALLAQLREQNARLRALGRL